MQTLSFRATPSRQSLFLFSLFLALALACRGALGVMQVDYPHPSQRASLALSSLLPILALGALGAWLAPLAGIPSEPASRTAWQRMFLWAISLGLIAGVAAVGLDLTFGLSRLLAGKLGISRIHLSFPASVFAYTAGAIVVECLYRIIPIPILLGLWKLVSRGRYSISAFWIVAVLTSLLEPLSQAGLFNDPPQLMWLLGSFIFAFNLGEAWMLSRFGLVAPLISRLSFYLVWHIGIGPFVLGA